MASVTPCKYQNQKKKKPASTEDVRLIHAGDFMTCTKSIKKHLAEMHISLERTDGADSFQLKEMVPTLTIISSYVDSKDSIFW